MYCKQNIITSNMKKYNTYPRSPSCCLFCLHFLNLKVVGIFLFNIYQKIFGQLKNSCTFEVLQSVILHTESFRNKITPSCVWFVIPYGITGCSDLPTQSGVFYFKHSIF